MFDQLTNNNNVSSINEVYIKYNKNEIMKYFIILNKYFLLSDRTFIK